METTANASRGLAGTPGIGPGNYFLEPGTKSPKQIIAAIKDGLYVTEFLGHGANLVTGDYSRGASGMWIVNGELAYPVEEITVAGNLKEMFCNISEIGSDLEFRGSVASPTIRMMTYDRRRVAEHCGINLFVHSPCHSPLTFHACPICR